jgi:hypothetical protein
MKLRLALALSALALPAYAQSLPTPNLGTGTKLNGANLQSAATKATGTSVADPGTGALENLLPVQTFTGASHTFVAADLYKETRRSNSGSAMTDTFPAASTAGLANGTMIQVNNADAGASITVSAGTGTTLNGNASIIIPPNRSTKWVYDAPNAVWRTTMNSLSGVNGPASATSGNIATFNGATGTLIQDSGKAAPAGTIVGTSDTQSLTNKSIDASEINSGTLASARMPALTGSCTTTAGTVATICEQDGAWPAFTPTVTSSGTLPTAATTAASTYNHWGTKSYSVTYVYNVTTLGSGTGGFLGLDLPNGTTSANYAGCSVLANQNTGTNAGYGYIGSGVTKATMVLGSLAANVYVMTCTFSST